MPLNEIKIFLIYEENILSISIFPNNLLTQNIILAQSAGVAEYTNCISAEE